MTLVRKLRWVAMGALIATGAPMMFASPAQAPAARPRTAPTLRYDVVASYRHDPDAFTQGLLFRDGFLYESTGRNGKSSLRKIRLETGEVVQHRTV